MHIFRTMLLGLILLSQLALGAGCAREAYAKKEYSGVIISQAFAATTAISSEEIECPPGSEQLVVYLFSDRGGTFRSWFLPPGGYDAGAVDSDVTTTASTIDTITIKRPMARSFIVWTPAAQPGYVWAYAQCGGAAR